MDIVIEAGGTLTVQVRDDDAGGADASRGSGLTGLRDRVEAVGGSMTVDSPTGPHRTDRAAPRHPRRSLIRTGRGAPRATCDPAGAKPPAKITNENTVHTRLACTGRLPPASSGRYMLVTMIPIGE